MASKHNDGSSGAVALTVILILMALAKEMPRLARRLTAWQVNPVTAAGVLVRSAYLRFANHSTLFDKACSHTAMNLLILLANSLRPYVMWFAPVCVMGAMIPWLGRRFGPARYWTSEPLIAAALAMGLGGVGFGLAMPAAWPWLLVAFGWAVSAANASTALYYLVLAAMAWRDDTRRLQHGPTFRLPLKSAVQAIAGGIVDRAILPMHSRWLARDGGDIRIPFDRLSCGVTILGEKGAGKSRLLFAIHDAIRAQYPSVPILIHDPKSEWYRTYYDKGTDVFFAPHFKGSAAWALWPDFMQVPELRHELLTTAVFAHQDRDDTFWMDQAVDLLDQASGCGSLDGAVDYLRNIPHRYSDDKFMMSVFGTAKLGFLDLAKVEKMAAAHGATARSIDDFLRWPGRIILLNNPACASEQKGAFSLFLSAFLLRAISMPDVPAGTLRAVIIIDEALTLSLPPGLEQRIYALCRSKGVCIVAGAQRLPDRQRNERGEWRNAEYTFAMKCVDQDTQRELSKRAGSLLFQRMTKSTTKSSGDRAGGASCTMSEHDVAQEAIPPEHFGRLLPRQFVLFHDQGIVTGNTVQVAREQRDVKLPEYDPRGDIREISVRLISKPKKEDKQ